MQAEQHDMAAAAAASSPTTRPKRTAAIAGVHAAAAAAAGGGVVGGQRPPKKARGTGQPLVLALLSKGAQPIRHCSTEHQSSAEQPAFDQPMSACLCLLPSSYC